jgi:putative ABC transport system substrate-binding protein
VTVLSRSGRGGGSLSPAGISGCAAADKAVSLLRNCANSSETAFATLRRELADALFVGPDPVFVTRRLQIALLAMRQGIPTALFSREMVEAGGMMSYGTDVADMFHQVGIYTGHILKGAKPADLPVISPPSSSW